MTRVGFAERRSLWSPKKPSKRQKNVNLSDDMSPHRFEELLANIAFSSEQNSSGDDRWSEIEPFVKAINEHRRSMVTPSESICIDQSISRWYGVGREWTDIDLTH